MKTQALHPRASLQRLFMLLMVAVVSLMVPTRAWAAAPAIVTQPTSLTLNAGGTATFTVGASGTPSPTYQWFFNGSLLPGRTNTMLTFANAQLPQAGVYLASVSNIDGTVQSAEARLTILPPGLQQTWVTRFSSPDGSYAAASAMKVDGLGNVFVTGTAGRNGAAGDLATLKLNASGVPLWTNWYNGPVNSTEWGGPLAIDASGQAFTVTESGGGATSYDYATIKIGAGGNPLWQARFSATTNSAENPRGIAVDPVSGNVYVTGNDEGPLTQLGWLTVAYSSSGAPLWTNRFAGMGGWAGASAALALDPSGNVLVAGYAEVAGSTDLVLIKYAPNGLTLWTATYDGLDHGSDSIFPFGAPMAVDAAGNVHVVGSSAQADSSTAMLTVKFAANGSLLWAARDQAVPGANDLAVAVVLDSVGNVHVTGVSSRPPGGQGDYLTRKYSAAGTRQWLARQPAEFAGVSAEIGGLAVDASNQAYVAARMQRVPNDGDIALWRYDTNGNRRRFVSYNGPGNGAGSKSDWPKALHVGSGGQVFVAGSSYSTGSLEYVVIKYLDTAINGRAGILAAPQDQTVAPGATTTFSLIAEGTAPLFYQWLYFGRPISGATNSTLMLANVQTNQAGDYSVEVRNAIGETRSPEATLVVAVPPPPPLAHHWKFDESTGLLARDAVGEWHGTLVNGPTRIAGKLAGALAFDGVNDYVQIAPSPAPNLPAAFSLSLWFKPAQLLNASSGRKDLFKKYLSTWLLLNYPSGDGRLAFVLNAGSPVVKSTTSSWNAGQWYHVICTHDGTAIRIYVNGALEGTLATTAAPAQNANPIQIGGNTDQSFYFPGGLDDVRLYDAALSGTEVATLFNSDNDPSSLQSLINAAAPGATLNLPARTYFETVVIDKNLTLVGVPGLTVLDGQSSRRVLQVATGAVVSVCNTIIRNGNQREIFNGDGGGILNDGSLTLSNVIVTANTADHGGGISSRGPLTLLSSQVISNGARYYASGIAATGPTRIYNSEVARNQPADFGPGRVGGVGGTALLWIENSRVHSNLALDSAGIESSGMLVLIGSEVSGNAGYLGGSAVDSSGLLLMTNTTVSGNGGGDLGVGGGVASFGQAVLDHVIVTRNRAPNAGGIWNGPAGTMLLLDCAVTDNSASSFLGGYSGGGILNQGTLTAQRTHITGNRASAFGGGIVSEGSLILNSCRVEDNETYGSMGGGIHNSGLLAATNTALICNRAYGPDYGSGGGAGWWNSGTGLAVNCTISSNTLRSGAGGGLRNEGDITLLSCTLVGNHAGEAADAPPVVGGVFSSGTFRSRNSIIAGNANLPTLSGPLLPATGPDFNGVLVSQGFNLFGNTTDCIITGVTTGNLLNVLPALGPLQDNGGASPTHALQIGSPALDAGDPAGFPATDQRELPRPTDGNGDCVGRPDIGAYERQEKLIWIEQAAPGQLRLRLVGTAGRSYAIQRSVTLSPTSWSYAGLMQQGGSPCLFEFQQMILPTLTNQFFRAVELP